MTKSNYYIWRSYSSCLASEVPLQLLTLKGTFSKALAEEVLRSVSASVAAVPSNRNNHLLVTFVIRENFLEAVAHFEEVAVLAEAAFEDLGFHFEVVGPVFDEGCDVPLSSVVLDVRVLLFKNAAIQVLHFLEILHAFELWQNLSIR